MINRNELIACRRALANKTDKNLLDAQLLTKLQRIINEPVVVYEITVKEHGKEIMNELYATKKKSLHILFDLIETHQLENKWEDGKLVYVSDTVRVDFKERVVSGV